MQDLVTASSTWACFPWAAAAASGLEQTEGKTAATDRTRAGQRVSQSTLLNRRSLLESSE